MAYRVSTFLGKPRFTVEFELSHDEIGDADDADMVVSADADSMLSNMGFPPLESISLMPLRYQIARTSPSLPSLEVSAPMISLTCKLSLPSLTKCLAI